MKQYTLKIYFGDKSEPAFFGGDRQDDSSNTTPFQVALKKSRDCNSYAACLCTGKELPLSVRLRVEKHHLARFPLTGIKHREDCRFYSSLSPEGPQGCYTQDALKEKPDGTINIKLDYPLQVTGPSTPIDSSLRSGDASRNNKRDTVSILGLLHFLWETTSYNTWVPKMDGMRSSTKLGYHLFKQAEKIEAGKTKLSDVLLTPAYTNSSDSRRNSMTVERAKVNKQRLVVIAELAKFSENFMDGLNRLPVRDFSGMPFLGLDDDRWKTALSRFPIAVNGWMKGMKVFVIAVTDVPSAKSAQVRQLALMMVSDRYIPLDSLNEGGVEQKLFELERSFYKPLRYDSSTHEYLADFCLTDVSTDNHLPIPVEIWGMNTPDYQEHRMVKERWYNANYGATGWLSWDATRTAVESIESLLPKKMKSLYHDIIK